MHLTPTLTVKSAQVSRAQFLSSPFLSFPFLSPKKRRKKKVTKQTHREASSIIPYKAQPDAEREITQGEKTWIKTVTVKLRTNTLTEWEFSK
jgi:hypothetical protein